MIPLPLIRRVMPTHIVDIGFQGVAPMTGPRFSIAKLRSDAIDRMIAEGLTFDQALEQMNRPTGDSDG